MKIVNFSLATAAVLASALFYTTVVTGCNNEESTDPCLNTSTYIDDSGARHVIDVPLPFAPGPVAVLSPSGQGSRVPGATRTVS